MTQIYLYMINVIVAEFLELCSKKFVVVFFNFN